MNADLVIAAVCDSHSPDEMADALIALAEAHEQMMLAKKHHHAAEERVRRLFDGEQEDDGADDSANTLAHLRGVLRDQGQPVPVERGARDRAQQMCDDIQRMEPVQFASTIDLGSYDPLDWSGIDRDAWRVRMGLDVPTDGSEPVGVDGGAAVGTRCPDCDALIEDCSCVPY